MHSSIRQQDSVTVVRGSRSAKQGTAAVSSRDGPRPVEKLVVHQGRNMPSLCCLMQRVRVPHNLTERKICRDRKKNDQT